MSLSFLLIASFFVALLAMLGGAPVCRRVAVKLRPKNVHSGTAVGVGGLVLSFALLLVSFYLTPMPDSAIPLIGAIGLILAFNFFLWLRFSTQRARLWRNRVSSLVLVVAVFGVIGLPQQLIFESTGAILTIGVAIVLTLTPLALASLADRGPVRAAMNSSYLVVPTMIGIVILGLKSDFSSGPAFGGLVDVLHVFLPALGAIAGCSFYTWRLPWRTSSQIRMGASGQMILGLICGWAAIQMATNSPRPGATIVAILWMMLPALFEVAREQIRVRVAPTLDSSQVHPLLIRWLSQPSSTFFVYAGSIVMMIVGLASFWSPQVSVWASGVAIPFAFGVYVLLGGWLGGFQSAIKTGSGSLKTPSVRR